jgi:hypothetical protein
MSKRALAIISTLAAAPVVALLALAGPANAHGRFKIDKAGWGE